MSLTLGVDPGQSGALAVLDSDGELFEIHDMPVVDKAVSPSLLADIITNVEFQSDGPLVAIVEQVHSMPKQGVASSFKFGCGYGIVLGVLAGNCVRVELVTPARWKRDMRLSSDKELSRRRAIARWPSKSQWFARKKDDGRAEAALLALWHLTYKPSELAALP